MLSRDMSLTSTPLLSSWGGEVNPTLDSDPVIGYPPFNIIHLTLQLISLWHQHLQCTAFPNHLIKTFSLKWILTSISSWSDLPNVSEVLPVFFCKNYFKYLIVCTHRKNMSRIFLCTMSRGHLIWPLLYEITFEPYSLWPGFTYSLRLVMSPFSTCQVRWGDSVKAYNFEFNLNDILFTIRPPQICILPKPWFLILGLVPPYPNSTTDNSFSSAW